MQSYVTVTHGISGWFAVLMEWNDKLETYEPYTTGYGRYETKEEAEIEAQDWAAAEELPYTSR